MKARLYLMKNMFPVADREPCAGAGAGAGGLGQGRRSDGGGLREGEAGREGRGDSACEESINLCK